MCGITALPPRPGWALTLGTIERRVHGSQDCRTRRAMLGEDCHADGKCHRGEAFSFELEVELPGKFADQFGTPAGHRAGCIWQDQDEFIAAVTTGDVLPAHLPEQQAAQLRAGSHRPQHGPRCH